MKNEQFDPAIWLLKARSFGYEIYLTPASMVIANRKGLNGRDGLHLEYGQHKDAILDYLETLNI